MLESELPPLVAERIRDELDRRMFKPFMERDFVWMHFGSNWTSICVNSAICAALATVTEEEKLNRLLRRMTPMMDTFVSGFYADGASSEGISCWNIGD